MLENDYTRTSSLQERNISLNTSVGQLKITQSAFGRLSKKDDPGVADFKVDGQIISDSETKSDLLNKQYSNVYTKEDLASIPAVGHSPKPTIGYLVVTLPGVIKQLTSLKPNKASGPDQIPPWFLKEYAHEIGPILTLTYQASIDSGIVPSR